MVLTQIAPNQGAKQSCEIHTRKPYTGNRPRHPRKNRPGPCPPALPPRLTAGVSSGSQPRAGAAVRRRRRRRDPGPRRRVIIPPARAGPGPGPRPPEPSPRPSREGSLLSLPPTPPPGPPPPPPPPQTRALPPRPPAAVRGHRRAPSSAAAVVARPDKLSAERPPSSGPPRLTGTSPGSRAMTPTEAEVWESGRITTTSYYGSEWKWEWVDLHGEPAWIECWGHLHAPFARPTPR
ncbi:basic proline-rich protein [Bubalus bubalis]|uniref:basic proline-rich protein n=1 Tax=Bubalus bubalis TaxID=89462 RepID=UPI001D1029F8|nr:basic proline-rich protein [Bubalus bubalis]